MEGMETAPPGLAGVLWGPADAGRVLHSFHHLKPNRRAWITLAIILGAPLVIGAAAGALVKGASIDLGLFIVIGAVCSLFFTARARVCERGLVMDVFHARRSAYVVPYATLDPASARVHTRIRFVPWRYRTQTARQVWRSFPPMTGYVIVSQTSRGWTTDTPLNIRGAPHPHYSVSFRGLHPVLASPGYRSKRPRRGLPSRVPAVLSAWAAADADPRLHDVVSYRGFPVMRWFLATDRPERLLSAVEEAMVAAGFADAAGMTKRAMADPYTEQPRTIPADPALW